MHQNKAKRTQNEANGNSLHTTPKLLGGCTGKGFVKGDPRINRSGRPKSLDQLRAMAQSIGQSGAEERILIDWANSPDVRKQELFMWYAYGKPPDKVETIIDDKRTLRLHWPHERPDLETANGNGNERN